MDRRLRTHFDRHDPVMAALARAAGPYRLEVRAEHSPFESLTRAIANQQLSSLVAKRILDRFVALFGSEAFPVPEAVLRRPDAELRAVGFSYAKIASIKDLASKAQSGLVPESHVLHTLEDAEIIERLTQVRGIGRWTVEMLLMFQLGRPDVLPVDDFGVRNGFRLAYGLRGLPTPRALASFGERWAPHRSAAAWYLWRAVDLSKGGQLPAPSEKPRGVKIVKRKAVVRKKASRSARKSARSGAAHPPGPRSTRASGRRPGRSRSAGARRPAR